MVPEMVAGRHRDRFGAGAAPSVQQPPRRRREWADMRTSVAITMLVCGTALVIMPQIHSAVLEANRLYASAIASHRPEAGAGEEGVGTAVAPGWMAPASTGLGGLLIV